MPLMRKNTLYRAEQGASTSPVDENSLGPVLRARVCALDQCCIRAHPPGAGYHWPNV